MKSEPPRRLITDEGKGEYLTESKPLAGVQRKEGMKRRSDSFRKVILGEGVAEMVH